MKRFLAYALVVALAGCGSGSDASSNPCDGAGIAKAIDAEVASSDAPGKRADSLDDLANGIVQCEAESATARTHPADPLNLQMARVNLEAGKAYALAGKPDEARRHLGYAAFTAGFIENTALESEIAAALKSVH